MAQIQVTPEVLMSKASEVRTLKGQHDEAIQRITTLVRGLNETWKGDAQNAFVNKFEGMQSTFKNFSELLDGYAKLMDTAAKELQNADQALKNAMNSF